jgi:hypothetical protein
MRYTRLKRQIKDGTLIGTRGTAFSPLNKKKSGASSKSGISDKKPTLSNEAPNEKRTGGITKRAKTSRDDGSHTVSSGYGEIQAKKQELDDEEGRNTINSPLPFDSGKDKKGLSLSEPLKYDPASPPLWQMNNHSSHPTTSSKRWPPPFYQPATSMPSQYPTGAATRNEGGHFKAADAKDNVVSFGRPWAPGVWGVDINGLKQEQ